MAGTVRDVKVHLNGSSLSTKIKSFKDYVAMYANAAHEISGSKHSAGLVGASPTGASSGKPSIIFEKLHERWEVAFTPSDGQFSQVSFVNSIATTKGGTHVEYITKQIVEQVVAVVNKKNKGELGRSCSMTFLMTFASAAPVKPFQVKNHLWVFVNCLIENPAFDSQTKENMTLAASKFGSKCKITEEFTKKGTLRCTSTASC